VTSGVKATLEMRRIPLYRNRRQCKKNKSREVTSTRSAVVRITNTEKLFFHQTEIR